MTAIERVRTLSPEELALVGLTQIAYLKPGEMDGHAGFAIHAADGRLIGFAPTQPLALQAMRENDLEPVSLH